MTIESRRRILEALDHCRQARERLGAGSAHRTRVLLDMTILALDRELALLEVEPVPPGPVAFGATR